MRLGFDEWQVCRLLSQRRQVAHTEILFIGKFALPPYT